MDLRAPQSANIRRGPGRTGEPASAIAAGALAPFPLKVLPEPQVRVFSAGLSVQAVARQVHPACGRPAMQQLWWCQ